MQVVTAGIMKRLDRKAIEEFGLPGLVLMENAARGAVGAIFRSFPDLLQRKVAVLAGGGNNGGDGLAVARYLINRGVACRVYLLAPRKRIKGDAAANLEILTRYGGEVVEILNATELEARRREIAEHDLIVDGIFGTGLNAAVTGVLAEIIGWINSLGKPVVAIDIPSGLDADSGEALGSCIEASLTVTFGLLKRGLLIQQGPRLCGRVVLIDISLPSEAIRGEGIQDHLIEGADFLPLLPPRRADAHKGDLGHLLVLAGSPGKTGAAALSCQAALRVGTGLITLGVPESLNAVLEMKLTEPMTEGLAETPDQTLGLAAFERIAGLLPRMKALAIGPGISPNKETAQLVRKVLLHTDLSAVIDADGLLAIGGRVESFAKPGRALILTPHPGEMARLTGTTAQEIQRDRFQAARSFAMKNGVILVLKGFRSLVAGPDGQVFINPTGNPGMASGGMGDALTGIIGGFLAQGLEPLAAAKLGVYLHGLAGDAAARKRGERGIAATDLIDHLPPVLRALASGTGEAEGFSFPLHMEIGY